jgi:hypothetical protein
MISEEEFVSWKRAESTRQVLTYFKDYRGVLMRRWASGEEVSVVEQAYAQILGDLLELSHADIEAFYEQEKPQEAETIDAK